MDQFARARLLLGDAAIARLGAVRVAVFGIGGVGGYALEALVRSGVGAVDAFDGDRVALSNINRQIIATHETVGRYKVDVAAERMRSINPAVKFEARRLLYLPECADQVDLSLYDYVIDAVDTVAAKLELAARCAALGVPEICALGAGNKLDPTRFRVADIYETSVDPLARVMRRELRRRGVERLKVVYSTEPPRTPLGEAGGEYARRSTPGSVAFVPPVMGLILAGEAVKDIAGVSGA